MDNPSLDHQLKHLSQGESTRGENLSLSNRHELRTPGRMKIGIEH